MRMSSASERKLVARRKALFRALEEMRGKPVIVEGKRDKESLESCMIKRIIPVNGRPREACEMLAGENEAVILTDFDKAGEEMLGQLSETLRGCGVRPNVDCRRMLRYALGLATFQEFDKRFGELMKQTEQLR